MKDKVKVKNKVKDKYRIIGVIKIEDIKMYYFKKLDSTNNKAKELEKEDEQFIVYTNNQTNGRGQFDRKWISENGLTFSIVLKKENSNYSKIVPEAIIDYLKNKGFEAIIKYPNDIYYKGKKLGGILIENIYNENKYHKTIIGIGLNINENEKISKIEKNAIVVSIDDKQEKIIKDIYSYIIKAIGLRISDNMI